MEAVALLQEWVQQIGNQAGCTAANTRIHSGAVGTPESRLEVRCGGGAWGLLPPHRFLYISFVSLWTAAAAAVAAAGLWLRSRAPSPPPFIHGPGAG